MPTPFAGSPQPPRAMRSSLAAALLVCLAAPALAQGDAPAPAPAIPPLDARLAPRADTLAPDALAQHSLAPEATRRRSSVTRAILPGTVGALLGGWLGYIASQVSRSDWDEEENGQFNGHRAAFAAGGAALGGVTGILLGRTLRGGGGGPRAPRLVQTDDRSVLTAEEIRGSTARNAYELIRNLRPRWLQTRGTTSFSEAGRGQSIGSNGVSITPGRSSIKVYMNNTPLGDVTILNTLDTGTFSEIRYFDSAAATYRWGEGHFGGAIEIITTPQP